MVLAVALLALLPIGAAPAPPPIQAVASPERGWPQWRGARRDATSSETGLLQAWPEGGPRRLWQATGLGHGWSAPIVAAGRIYITGDIGDDLVIRALDLQGRPLWRAVNGRAWKGQFQGSRSACTYSAGRVFSINAHGRVACLDAATGQEKWAVDILDRFGGANTTWAISECLLVDGSRVIVTVGGKRAVMAALDVRDGHTAWATPPILLGPSSPPNQLRVPEPAGEADGPGYGSPLLFTYRGRRLIAAASTQHIFCVDAATGALLWTRPFATTYKVLGLTPVALPDGIFYTGPDGGGGRLFAFSGPAASPTVTEKWRTTLDTCHAGAVALDGVIYGAWYRRPAFGAIDARTGATLHQTTEIIQGSIAAADGRLYCLAESGEMQLVRPSRKAWEVASRFTLVEGRRDDVWTHPVITGGRLYLRYHDDLWCYDIRRPSAGKR